MVLEPMQRVELQTHKPREVAAVTVTTTTTTTATATATVTYTTKRTRFIAPVLPLSSTASAAAALKYISENGCEIYSGTDTDTDAERYKYRNKTTDNWCCCVSPHSGPFLEGFHRRLCAQDFDRLFHRFYSLDRGCESHYTVYPLCVRLWRTEELGPARNHELESCE